MIDTAAMRELAKAGGQLCSDGSLGVVVSARWLEQVAAEIEAGRKARESLDRIDERVDAQLNIGLGRLNRRPAL